jgi:hypothetical protein
MARVFCDYIAACSSFHPHSSTRCALHSRAPTPLRPQSADQFPVCTVATVR